MKELRVEDALLYLDQVKVEFGDRPHIYNEFLDIMKTFKTQQIDTPGVIRRVSNLFQGNRRLVLGFNTFLPEGYKIELPADGEGPPVAVFRAPGSTVTHVLNGPMTTTTTTTTTSPPMAAVGPSVAEAPRPPPGPAGMLSSGAAPPSSVMRVPSSQLHSANRALPMRGTTGPPQPPQHRGPGSQLGPQNITLPENGSLRIKPTDSFSGRSQGQTPMGHAQQHNHSVRSPIDQQSSMVNLANAASPSQQPQVQSQPLPHVGARAVEGKLPARVPSGRPVSGGLQPAQKPVGLDGDVPPPHEEYASDDPLPPQKLQVPKQQETQVPLEFDHAINYVTTIKKRFANEPETYKKFLEILHTYQKEQRGIKEVLDEVSVLFADHPDLLKQFTYFLPDAVQAQAKQQLDVAVKEAETRKRSQAKQAIMHQAQGMQQQAQQKTVRTPPVEYERVVHVPFGATQGRTAEEERALVESARFGTVSFVPVRQPKMLEDKKGVHTTAKLPRPKTIPDMPLAPKAAETAFFYRVEHHLSRKELLPEKPVGSKRHTPYIEFIKCLHLFGAGILNKEELVLLLRGLLTQGHAPKASAANNPQIATDAADLLREFEQILIGRGPYADQEAARIDKSKYGTVRARDMDFSDCDRPTPSYRSYPSDYPASVFLVHPSRHHLESQILNDAYVAIPTKRSKYTDSLEAYDGIKKRHNTYEEAMSRIADERYEVDMAIARNAQALFQIEPIAQECLRLRQTEEKDGQPIGRLQYQINKRNAITPVVINAIARVYGDRGDEVIHHLARNPLIVLPIVYQRLKQKQDEWRLVRDSCKEQWNAATEANYEGCMDVQCYFLRRKLERSFGADFLVDQCQDANRHYKQRTQSDDVTFSVGMPDSSCLFFEPCITVSSEVGPSHKDAFQLVTQKVNRSPNAEPVDLERIGRIWAEFMVPWYNYPAYWVMNEIRQSFSGRLSQSVVKFAFGQKVRTSYGEGSVTMFEGGRYRVKLNYGTAFLAPSAILHSIPSKDAPFIRRDGKMERDTNNTAKSEGPYLPPSCQILFATRRIYLFLRLHLQLCYMLSDLRHACNNSGAVDPASKYVVAPGETQKVDHSVRLDYAGMIAGLKNVIAKKCDHKSFETFGRKISREHVHMISSLPRLVDRCADALISLAKEDAVLHLFDFCQYRELNPAIVRDHCFSMAPDADFRVQRNGKYTSFSYLPRGVPMPTSPRKEEKVNTSSNGEKRECMELDEDPIEEYDDEPASKRLKVK
ncbi:hypothetical protein ACA910_005076 [Epithemia clementina (nom. ined.)]